MFIDENKNVINEYDPSIGNIVSRNNINVKSHWIEEVAEEGHWETIQYYPETGGEDVEWIVDIPEQGHWESIFDDGLEHPEYVPQIPTYINKANDYEDTFEIVTVHIYTQEEKDAIQKKNEEMIAKQKQKQEFIENGSSRLDAAESAQLEMMQAIAELGVLVGGAQ